MIYQDAVQAISQGVGAVVRNSTVLTKRLFFYFALYAILLLIMQIYEQSIVVQLIGGLLAFLIFIVVSVTTHRTIILREMNPPFFGIKTIGSREWQFFLALFEILFYTLPCVVFLFIPYVGEYLAITVSAYIISRVSLIFPSVAINVPMTSRTSWQATKNRKLMMFTVVFLFSVFFATLEWALSMMGVPMVIVALFSLFTAIFLVGALSEAYKTIMSNIEI